jgi:hypothetical protein
VVIESNKIRKGWSMNDYINYYAANGKQDYICLAEKIEKWNQFTSLSSIISAYSKSATNNLKLGGYLIDVDFGDRLLLDCYKLNKHTEISFYTKFVQVLRRIKRENNNFNVNQLIKNVSRKKLRVYTNFTDTHEHTIEVYNYKLRSNNRIN